MMNVTHGARRVHHLYLSKGSTILSYLKTASHRHSRRANKRALIQDGEEYSPVEYSSPKRNIVDRRDIA
jgi:hypothetical protein